MNTEQVSSTPFCPVMSFMVDQATRTEPVPTPGKASVVHLSPFHNDFDPDGSLFERLFDNRD